MLELRPIQERSLDLLREKFKEGHRSVLLYGPTGCGKTEMAIALMNAAKAKGSRSAMILDRIVLCEQTSQRLQKYSIDHGVLQSGHWRYRPHEHIQVCSAQTIEKRGSLPGLQMLLVDEAHAQRKQTTEFIKNAKGFRVVGLSASPFTKGLGNTYSAVVSAATTRELVDQGWLAPMRVFIAKQIDMTGAKKKMGEWSDTDATERGIRITGDIVAEWVKKTHEIFGMPKKTIVFCAGVAHGEDLAKKFAEAGYNFVSISYKDDDQFKQDAFAEFAKTDSSIHGLIATDILTKGYDQSDCMIGISARPFSKSFSSHVQQMGRIMRQHHGKEFCVWLCHSGNFLRFKDQWEDLYENGVSKLDDGAEKTKPEPSDEEKERAKCPACGAVWVGNQDTCVNCGHARVRHNEVVDVAGELVELTAGGKDKVPGPEKERWFQELLGYAISKGYKDGWAWHKYQQKFKVKPVWEKKPATPTREVIGWIISQSIRAAYAKNR